MGRDNFDLRNTLVDTRELTRTVVGLRGDVTENIQYDISFVHGQVERELLTQERIEDRFFAAIDAVIDPATGETVCRSDIDQSRLPTNIHDIDADVADYFGNFNTNGDPTYSFFSPYNINDFGDPNAPSTTFTPGPNSGCVPLNLWGYQAASEEAIAWTHLPTITKSKLTQQVFSAVLTGDSEGMFSLPAGPLGFALGMEYREEKSRITPDDLNLRGATWEAPLPATTGKFDVTEFFGEVLIPIVSDKTMFQDLSIGGAVRVSDYSTIGDTTTWSANLRWALVDSFALRGSFGQAIRAPNVNELFAPQANELFEPTDPCLPTFIGLGSSTREANCTQALADVGLALADLSQASGPFFGISGGNPDLLEETSDSYTFGAVWTPTFIDGLSVTLDYWNIEIEDAILETEIDDIINSCYDAPDLNNQFCDTLTRSSINGIFTAGQTSTVNIGSFESSGIDLEVNYAFEVANLFRSDSHLGDANIRLVGTKLDSLSVISVPGNDPDGELGELNTLLGGPAPENIVNLDVTWSRENLSVNYQYSYISGMLRLDRTALAQKPDTQFPFDTKSRKRHDLSAAFQFNDNLEIFGGINNLSKPSREIGFIPVDRVYFFGVRYFTGG
jgi:outer membrane receptor protein involved in Fe transport